MPLRLLAVFALLALGCGDRNRHTLRSDAARVEVTLEPFGFVVQGRDGAEVLRSLPGGGDAALGAFAGTTDTPTFVSHIVPGWDGYTPNEGPWRRGAAATVVESSSSHLVVAWPVEDGEARVRLAVDGPRVRIEGAITASRVNKVTMGFALPDDEHVFGLGERFGTFDHRGHALYSWAEEGALGAGEGKPVAADNPYPNGPSMTYFPVPFFHSTRGYGLHVDTTFRSELRFGDERADAWRVAVNAKQVALTVYVDPSPVKVLDLFTADTGRPLEPAPWVFGPRRRIGREYTVDGGAEYLVMRERKLPLTAVDDAMHFLPALSHLGLERELAAWTRDAHAQGYKVMAYNNPYLAANHVNAAPDWAFAVDAGFLVKGPDGKPATDFLISGTPLTIGMVDFTNPDAETWYRGLLQRTVALGYDGWMHDFGEYVPRNGRFSDGRRGDELHNLYPVLSAKQARAVLQAAKPDDHLFFVRAGYTGSQAHVPAVWGGDAETSFDETQGVPSTIRSGLNLALVGVPYWGSDFGGFKCLQEAQRDKELYLRWVALAAVSPIMMDQDACSNPFGRRTKWTLWSDDETQQVYRRWAGLHTRLQPYFLTLARVAHETGLPLMRAPFLFWPNEPRTWTLDDTFFLGPALYAAPVVRRGQTTRTVWLPPGARYVEWTRLTLHEGGSDVTVPAPIDALPLFLVEGQVLPLLDEDVQTLAPATSPGVVTVFDRADVLDVVVALAPSATASLTLVDGATLTARRAGGATSPGLREVASAAEVRSCRDCYHRVRREGFDEVLVVGQASVTVDGLTLELQGGPSRRVRWRVLLLPERVAR
jgi:alpha-glucosidase (family GH31 glycosyl hydrolase)